ncbi:hypothetical protein SteCoe_32930 [Stentor coeruleus]|uniref:Uncharacterized protein n=1 Tax=Stentor coeruleus TaxID=5963 RepID=A0A1R2AXY9_9CILI|nr:hypothetical protein SteCoe_32930 [Stentor coeruleus]
MTLDGFTENSIHSIEATIVFSILIFEYAICAVINVLLLKQKMTYNLTAFYFFLLLQCFLIEVFFIEYFIPYPKAIYTSFYFASDLLLSTSINCMVYEWLKIVILSKNIIISDKGYLINKGFYLILIITLVLWLFFFIFIIVAIFTDADYLKIMFIFYVISSFTNFVLVSIVGIQLIKVYEQFLEESNHTLSKWIYLGIVISLIKILVPCIFLIDKQTDYVFTSQRLSIWYALVNHNIAGILPMFVYHQSFKLSFIVIDDNKRSTIIIENHLKTIILYDSTHSLESLGDNYAQN